MEGFPFLELLPVIANSEVFSTDPHANKIPRVVKVKDSSNLEFDCFWQGGSNFEFLNTGSAILAEAVYADPTSAPAAVISGTYGRGTTVLLGLHPEIPFTELVEYMGPTKESSESVAGRKSFLEGLFRKLKIQEQTRS